MKHFTAKFSDLGGQTNPNHVWSVAFVRLNTLLNNGATTSQLLDALRRWLSERGVKPADVDAVIRDCAAVDSENPEANKASAAEKAYKALLGLIHPPTTAAQMLAGGEKSPLPKTYTDTLKRAVSALVGDYVNRETAAISDRQKSVDLIRSRYGDDAAATVVDSMLDQGSSS